MATKDSYLQKSVKIIIKGEDKTDSVCDWEKEGDKFRVVYSNGSIYYYNLSNVKIKKSVLSENRAFDCFQYLKSLADTVGLEDANVGNILANYYEKISFVNDEESLLAAFLTGKLKNTKEKSFPTIVYPFGFNLSQKEAIDSALTNSLSIIEGPPGTGKTQTILNIIANAVMRNETVAVVSSNNSATANVLSKLKKYDVGFIAAYLGNLENKQQFIESQEALPDLSSWKLSFEQEARARKEIRNIHLSLNDMLVKKNKLSKLQQELEAVEVEYKHFSNRYNYSKADITQNFKVVKSEIALDLWLLCEQYAERKKSPGILGCIVNRFRRGVINRKFYSLPFETMVLLCQKHYYMMKLDELSAEVSKLKEVLGDFNFSKKMNEYSELSTKLFRTQLATKYLNSERKVFEIGDLRRNSVSFVEEYPVVLATTYSLCGCLAQGFVYDYVIIDEASQVDLVTGALALSCAKTVVVVGDLKQLPNVVDSESAYKTDLIFENSNLPEVYRYKNHSLLSSLSEMFPEAPKTLLKEHYRCHPKIIGFCNQKFYDNQLIILTEDKSECQPLVVYKTVEGNHARNRLNQRQIDVIKNEIIPKQNINDAKKSIGIVTPYRNQTNALQNAFEGTDILADTVDKFQGRENDIIILSTVDNEITEFADNSNRLNVAVSRAIDQLIVVVNGGDDVRDTNIKDLVNYIEYNNFEVINSEIFSIFDYLYKSYNEKRRDFLLSKKKISQYDSENLMYALIKDVLAIEAFSKFDVAIRVPLRMIFSDMNRLNEEERKYAENILTHVDFMIYDKCSKAPRLGIEVDGISFHDEGKPQAERDKLKNSIFEKYELPFVRFRTNESGERDRLISKMNEIMGNV